MNHDAYKHHAVDADDASSTRQPRTLSEVCGAILIYLFTVLVIPALPVVLAVGVLAMCRWLT